MNRKEFLARLQNKPRGLALETGLNSSAPDAIQQFATAIAASQTATAAAVTNLGAGVLVLDQMIIAFQNTPGQLSAADQASLNAILAQSAALATQVGAISVTPPGATAPVTPLPTTTP